MVAVRSGDTIYIGKDFVQAISIEEGRSVGKIYSVLTSYNHSFMVRADTVDEAQRHVESVYKREGKRKPHSYRIQLQ